MIYLTQHNFTAIMTSLKLIPESHPIDKIQNLQLSSTTIFSMSDYLILFLKNDVDTLKMASNQ
jgi:hypothetical protein